MIIHTHTHKHISHVPYIYIYVCNVTFARWDAYVLRCVLCVARNKMKTP